MTVNRYLIPVFYANIRKENGEEKSGTTAESGAEALSQSIPDVLPESVRKATAHVPLGNVLLEI